MHRVPKRLVSVRKTMDQEEEFPSYSPAPFHLPQVSGTYDTFTLLLVILLLVAAFLLGMLVTKVQTLASTGVEKIHAQAIAAQTAISPTPLPG